MMMMMMMIVMGCQTFDFYLFLYPYCDLIFKNVIKYRALTVGLWALRLDSAILIEGTPCFPGVERPNQAEAVGNRKGRVEVGGGGAYTKRMIPSVSTSRSSMRKIKLGYGDDDDDDDVDSDDGNMASVIFDNDDVDSDGGYMALIIFYDDDYDNDDDDDDDVDSDGGYMALVIFL
ncbi:hypothetical protein ElyMa_000716600 [Elysia marginata]|uniref:Uncharacterized protein n=1 Tax=Elysia marginata TaxID=1093978 RepID=A0AAV4GPI7_9GAST|nr:hypothetical protein ElyMa_000716600 [Elysia marginata]